MSSGGSSVSGGGGGSNMSGGGGSGFVASGGGPSGVRGGVDNSGRIAATGGSGVVVGRAVHGGASAAYPRELGAASSDHTAGRVLGTAGTTRTGDVAVPRYSRPRDGAASQGTAVPRGSVTTTPIGSGDYGGYYGGYWDPVYGYVNPRYGYGYGYDYGYGYGYGYGYDPWLASTMMGGFYTDPWYGGMSAYSSSGGSSETWTPVSKEDDSALRLKIKPRSAEVFVDGYFVGLVNDFDGVFQKLHIESGAHRVEIRAPGYETLDIDLRVAAGKTSVYTGELKKIQ